MGDGLKRAKAAAEATRQQVQYGIRWPSGAVFAYSSRHLAEVALSNDGRGVGVLVVHEIEPGTPNSTEWREVVSPETLYPEAERMAREDRKD